MWYLISSTLFGQAILSNLCVNMLESMDITDVNRVIFLCSFCADKQGIQTNTVSMLSILTERAWQTEETQIKCCRKWYLIKIYTHPALLDTAIGCKTDVQNSEVC